LFPKFLPEIPFTYSLLLKQTKRLKSLEIQVHRQLPMGLGLAQNHNSLSHVTALSQRGVTRVGTYGSKNKCADFEQNLMQTMRLVGKIRGKMFLGHFAKVIEIGKLWGDDETISAVLSTEQFF
jgi:hypothetical protein